MLYLGTFREDEAKDRENKAKALIETWKDMQGFTREWAIEQLEKKKIRTAKTRQKNEEASTRRSSITTRSDTVKRKQITIIVSFHSFTVMFGFDINCIELDII